MEDLIGDLTSVPQPIEIKLYADDQPTLERTAAAVAEAVGKIDGVVDVKSGLVIAGDALDIQIDPLKAALEGIDPAAITAQLERPAHRRDGHAGPARPEDRGRAGQTARRGPRAGAGHRGRAPARAGRPPVCPAAGGHDHDRRRPAAKSRARICAAWWPSRAA